jgi:Domain of unknown function (DUF4457)
MIQSKTSKEGGFFGNSKSKRESMLYSFPTLSPRQQKITSFVQILQPYIPISTVQGLSCSLTLLTTHGDNHYLGLNAIEIFDYSGQEILTNKDNGNYINDHKHPIHQFILTADPPSVSYL